MSRKLAGLLRDLRCFERSLVRERPLACSSMMARGLARVVDNSRCAGVKRTSLAVAEPAGDDLGEQRVAKREIAPSTTRTRPVATSSSATGTADASSGRPSRARSPESGASSRRAARMRAASASSRLSVGSSEPASSSSSNGFPPRADCQTFGEHRPRSGLSRRTRVAAASESSGSRSDALEARVLELADEGRGLCADPADGRDDRSLACEEWDGLACLSVRPLEIVEQQNRLADRFDQLARDVRRIGAVRLATECAAKRQIGEPRERRQRPGLDELQLGGFDRSPDESGLAHTCLAVDDDRPTLGKQGREQPQLRLPPDEHGSHHRSRELVAQLHDEAGRVAA